MVADRSVSSEGLLGKVLRVAVRRFFVGAARWASAAIATLRAPLSIRTLSSSVHRFLNRRSYKPGREIS
jgi:hypothetical protein